MCSYEDNDAHQQQQTGDPGTYHGILQIGKAIDPS